LECADIVHRVLDLVFGPLRQRPITETEPAANGIEITIDEDRKVVSGVPEQRQPARMLDHHVEHVAMHHEIAPCIGGFMDRGLDDFDAAEMRSIVVAQKLVVVAGQINDSRTLARLAQEFLHDVVMMLRPEPAGAQLPAVDDIADQINGLGIVITQKLEKLSGLAAASAEMYIRDKQSAEFCCALLGCHRPKSRAWFQIESSL